VSLLHVPYQNEFANSVFLLSVILMSCMIHEAL